MTRCMRRRAAVEEGIVPGGGVALLRAPSSSAHQDRERRPEDRRRDRAQAVRARPPDRDQRPVKTAPSSSGKTPREGAVQITFRLADLEYGPRHQGNHRPNQGRSCGDPETRPPPAALPDHHRSHESPNLPKKKRWRRAAACPPGGGMGGIGFSKSPSQRYKGMQNPGKRCRGFVLGRPCHMAGTAQ